MSKGEIGEREKERNRQRFFFTLRLVFYKRNREKVFYKRNRRR